MKIKDRKYTTDKGLEELNTLIKSFGELDADINMVTSNGGFECVADIGGDVRSNWSDLAEFCIKDGELTLRCWTEEHGYFPEKTEILSIVRIDFSGAIKALETAIDRYNDLCAEKDTEIESFLEFCKKRKKQNGNR